MSCFHQTLPSASFRSEGHSWTLLVRASRKGRAWRRALWDALANPGQRELLSLLLTSFSKTPSWQCLQLQDRPENTVSTGSNFRAWNREREFRLAIILLLPLYPPRRQVSWCPDPVPASPVKLETSPTATPSRLFCN